MSSASSLNAFDAVLMPVLARRNFFRAHRPNPGAAVHYMNNDDTECMTRLAAGDSTALRPLYERHGRALLRFSAAMCRSRQAAEDLVHDTFVALLREPVQYDPAQGSVYGYLCGVLRHRVSRHYRTEKRWVALDPDADGPQSQPADAQTPVDEIARSEVTAAFRRAMLELPLQHREIIALCDLEELPYATVASILHCPLGTVRSRLHRARALLTIRLASLELVDLHGEMPMPQRGLS
jgi:RNA polymerase sigma-70 factor, ECF subfamily